jgi:formylglycine-generating enzyme required for sulfatase activity/predicted Ser/Thr protein kinase/dienelactone hydrolase
MSQQETTAEQLFGQALDLPRERRPAFLDLACAGEPALRATVQNLLDENDRLSGFLSAPVFGKGAETAAAHLPGVTVGCRLVERYRIVGTLGSGGMGVVYRGRDEKLERDVAIKVLQPGLVIGVEERERFRREARALAKLNHTHIAAVYDVIEEEGADFIVMELVAGDSLAAKLRGGALGAREATVIALQVAEALEEAHEHGVIHRDLKPGNVMVTPKGQAKVLDFGLAKLLLGPGDATQNLTDALTQAQEVMGTPLYMSPEQALGKVVDARTDLWSLGVVYYEALTGKAPFGGGSSLAVLQAVTTEGFSPVTEVRPELPAQAGQIVERALEKDPERRYASAAEMVRDLGELLSRMSGPVPVADKTGRSGWKWIAMAVVLSLAVAGTVGWWLYRRAAERMWARDEAGGQIEALIDARKPLAAFALLDRAQRVLPEDGRLRQIAEENTQVVSVDSDPAGAEVSIQDYLTPGEGWHRLGTTPLKGLRIPKGYFRWKAAKAGAGEEVVAPATEEQMDFALTEAAKAPAGMVYVGAGQWANYAAFLGWLGPYKLPAYYVDRDEVTNRDYQKFVDAGGYGRKEFWPAEFRRDGKAEEWSAAMTEFRDTTGRSGPSTWAAGHYPEGQGDFPVSGVSWYEASAYAAFAGKSLPVLAQWEEVSPPDVAQYMVPMSNIASGGPAAVGTFQGLGPFGTYDTAGNVREWTANVVDNDLRFILGGSWKSPLYLSTSPEALSPFDRAEGNGFRCVRNLAAVPEAAVAPFHSVKRDFATFKPANDEVFKAYELLYAYEKTPLNVKEDGVVKETADWREEKITFDAAYNGERMAAYLFLPKRVQAPYQTVLFFPSARVMFLPPDSSELGDVKFFDYILQSGRAVMYPVYQDTYERRSKHRLPGGSEEIGLPTEWYKDAARSLDYLATRKDIDSTRLAYLGVSMGSADGIIITTLLQDRLKTAIFLDGGYFLQKPPAGADQADFAPRMKKPVLMVNGRYDYTFPVETAQDPLFRMLGTPADEKSHVVLDTPHDVTEDRSKLVKVVLDWLDKYLGRVG